MRLRFGNHEREDGKSHEHKVCQALRTKVILNKELIPMEHLQVKMGQKKKKNSYKIEKAQALNGNKQGVIGKSLKYDIDIFEGPPPRKTLRRLVFSSIGDWMFLKYFNLISRNQRKIYFCLIKVTNHSELACIAIEII